MLSKIEYIGLLMFTEITKIIMGFEFILRRNDLINGYICLFIIQGCIVLARKQKYI